MEPELMQPAVAPPVATDAVRGYSRATVDEFVAAADAERVRLKAAIAEAKERQAKSRSVIGMHRVMLAMLLEAQEELHSRRRDAEAAAEEVLRRADAEAEAILAAVHSTPTYVAEPQFVPSNMTPPVPEAVIAAELAVALPTDTPVEPIAAHGDALVIDLQQEHRREGEVPTRNGVAAARQPVFTTAASSRTAQGSSEEFFMFLRGALSDEEPLGPRYE
jgi:hypothetical protein